MRRLPLLSAVAVALGVVTLAVPASATSPAADANFPTVSIPQYSTLQSNSDGDLWANCWSDDGNLYAANGDGKGFSTGGTSFDVAVSRISGNPGSLTGSTVAGGAAVSQVWSGSGYTRKPTGMACVGGTIYLAVQDLNTAFTSAPAATIVKSTDHGATWTWDTSAPMFSGSKFTTIFFADYGQANANNGGNYLYAYGLDNNWRFTGTNTALDPVDLWLARVPVGSVQNRSTWEFYTGTTSGTPTWSTNINSRVAVLHDDRRVYTNSMVTGGANNMTTLSQGGVLYDAPLGKYIYTSWTEYTFELYDSPTPYGPWTRMASKDFGGYPWTQTKNGGYATTIPSKWLSSDGKSAYLQANVCPCGGGGTSVYNFALRPVSWTTGPTASPTNGVSTTNLGRVAGTVTTERVAHYGHDTYWNDGSYTNSEDDWNNEHKTDSWWGYTWPKKYTVDKVVYTTGSAFSDGGWFASNLRVQVRNGATWSDVTTSISPAYPYSSAAGGFKKYTLTFPATAADGVRIYGAPGGTVNFTTVSELEAYYS